MPKRSVTGYMLFATEQRQSVADELRAGEEKAGVPAVARILGRMWKEMPEEQRQAYKDRAAEKQKELHENDAENNDQPEKVEDTGPPPALSLGSIKKIMIADEDVKRVSTESVQVMTKATELLISYVVERSFEEAKKEKRKLIKLLDIENAVLLEPRLKATNTLAYIKQLAEAAKKRKPDGGDEDDGNETTKPPSGKKAKKDVKDQGQKTTITSFLQSK